jgi:hypothetical protein
MDCIFRGRARPVPVKARVLSGALMQLWVPLGLSVRRFEILPQDEYEAVSQ